MCSTKRLPRNLGRLVLLTCLASVLGFSVPACSFGGGNTTLSPEAQAKVRENFKKRFVGLPEKTKDRKTSRGNHSSPTQRRAPP